MGKIGIRTPVLTEYRPDTFEFDPEKRINRRRGDKPGSAAGGGGFGSSYEDEMMMMEEQSSGFGRPPARQKPEESTLETKSRYTFKVEFVWVPTPIEQRTDEPPAGDTAAEAPVE